jgi:hydroxyacylglutathione hydrolase
MLKVSSVPILDDNYVHIPWNTDSGECIIVDPGVAAPVRDFVRKQGLKPTAIFCTHKHGDHIGGVAELRGDFPDLKTYAPLREKAEIPFADIYLSAGESVAELGTGFKILELPGHTRGHIAYWNPLEQWLFSGDVLFSLGCGRVFDGTLEDHYASLQKIEALPPQTEVFCTHEYTETNLRFCQEKKRDHPELFSAEDAGLAAFAEKVRRLRSAGKATVPFRLEQEWGLNPFLRAADFETFRKLRELRNRF